MDNKVIHIGMPLIENRGDKARVVADIKINGETRLLWFEVPAAYEKYLCAERSDGFLVGLLFTAFHEGYDIECEAPVSERLLYHVRTCLIPVVTKSVAGLHCPTITAATISRDLENAGAVGMGISCGVDAMHILSRHWNGSYGSLNVSHLILYNVGAFWKEGSQFSWQLSQARKFSNEYGIPLIETDSNLHIAFPRDHLYALEYSNCMAILMLQKLWKVYFHGSTGYDFRDHTITELQIEDSSYFDLLSCYCFSTDKMTIISEGFPNTRFEKTKDIVDFEPAQKYLDVCVMVGEGSASGAPNCGICFKCRRTLLMLDCLGALDKFNRVFDVKYYLEHINEYYEWLLRQDWAEGNPGNHMIAEIYRILKPRMPKILVLKDFILRKKFAVKNGLLGQLKRFRTGYLFYRRYIRRYPNWQDI